MSDRPTEATQHTLRPTALQMLIAYSGEDADDLGINRNFGESHDHRTSHR